MIFLVFALTFKHFNHLPLFVDLTPCISPLPHDVPVLEKAVTSQLKEDTEVTGVRKLFGKMLVILPDFLIFELQYYISGCYSLNYVFFFSQE